MRPSRIVTLATACITACLVLAPSARAQASASAPAPVADWRAPVQKILRDVRRIAPPGIDQWISVRGRDRRNPILLFIHGGPASTEAPVSWLYQSGWEDYFTVVQWDQRGAGKTYVANDPATTEPTITRDRMVADGEELVAWLRTTYGRQKIFVLGHSWGTIIGLEVARRHPDWLHAYIGMGQMIYGRDNERLGYDWALQAARADHNDKAVRDLQAIAPYPRADGSVSVQQIITQRTWVIHYGGLTWGRPDFDDAQDAAKLSPDYTRKELSPEDGIGESLPRLLPAMLGYDERGVTHMDLPGVHLRRRARLRDAVRPRRGLARGAARAAQGPGALRELRPHDGARGAGQDAGAPGGRRAADRRGGGRRRGRGRAQPLDPAPDVAPQTSSRLRNAAARSGLTIRSPTAGASDSTHSRPLPATEKRRTACAAISTWRLARNASIAKRSQAVVKISRWAKTWPFHGDRHQKP